MKYCFHNQGRGVFADWVIERNEYVLEYIGDFLDTKAAR